MSRVLDDLLAVRAITEARAKEDVRAAVRDASVAREALEEADRALERAEAARLAAERTVCSTAGERRELEVFLERLRATHRRAVERRQAAARELEVADQRLATAREALARAHADATLVRGRLDRTADARRSAAEQREELEAEDGTRRKT